MAEQSGSLVIAGIRGTVLALDKSSGSEVWRTKLGGSHFVNVVVDGDAIFAATRGRVYCLSYASGSLRWENELKGLGFGLVTLGGAGGQYAALAEKVFQEQRAAAAAAAAGASTS